MLGTASSQEAVALPGRQGACTRQSPQTAHGKQTGVPAAVTVMVQGGQSALSDCCAGESVAEPRAVTARPRTGVSASNAGPQTGEHAAHIEPGLESPGRGFTTLETTARLEKSSAAGMLQQVGSARWHQLKELEIAQVTGKIAGAALEQSGAAVSSGGAVSVEERAVEEEEVRRMEAAAAVKRIAQEQQLQLEESFASAQRAVLVASEADTPEEREAAWAVRKQYVIDQRADRGQAGPIPPAALKQLEVGTEAGREQGREPSEQYAAAGSGTPPPDYSSQRNTPEGVSSSGSFRTPTSAASDFSSPASGNRSAGVAAAVSTADAEVDLLENEVDRVVQLEDSIRQQHLVEEDRLAQRLLAIQAEGQARVQEAQRLADERASAQIESANKAAEERINSHALQLQESLSEEVSKLAKEARTSGGAALGLILESKELEVKIGRRLTALEVASADAVTASTAHLSALEAAVTASLQKQEQLASKMSAWMVVHERTAGKWHLQHEAAATQVAVQQASVVQQAADAKRTAEVAAEQQAATQHLLGEQRRLAAEQALAVQYAAVEQQRVVMQEQQRQHLLAAEQQAEVQRMAEQLRLETAAREHAAVVEQQRMLSEQIAVQQAATAAQQRQQAANSTMQSASNGQQGVSGQQAGGHSGSAHQQHQAPGGGPPDEPEMRCTLCGSVPVVDLSAQLCIVCKHSRDNAVSRAPLCAEPYCHKVTMPGRLRCEEHMGQQPPQQPPLPQQPQVPQQQQQQQQHQQQQQPQQQQQQQQQGVSPELLAILQYSQEQARHMSEQSTHMSQMLLTVSSQQTAAAAEQRAERAKPRDSAKFSAVSEEIWIKIRALLDHAGTGQVAVPASGVSLVGQQLYEHCLQMASDSAVDDSFEYTQSACYNLVELLIGANDNEDAAHPVQLMDFAARRYLNNWRGKRGQQVWVPCQGLAQQRSSVSSPSLVGSSSGSRSRLQLESWQTCLRG